MLQSRLRVERAYILLFFVLAALLVGSGLYITAGMQAFSRYQQNMQASQQHCGGQLPVHVCVRAPTAIFSAFYPYYQATQYPLFAVDYNSSTPLTLLVSISIAHVSQVQTRTVNANSARQSSYFVPPLPTQVLQGLTQEETTSLHIEVSDTRNHLYYVNDTPLLMHSRWLMQWTAAHRLNIAAWVTPDDPAITTLVNQASARLPDQLAPAPANMVGYSTAAPQQVADQVDAIYDTLRLDYHMRYMQTSVPYTGTADTNPSTEQIKLPGEVLQQHSGMCVELTILLASAVESIGLHSEIVIIPGHAFLGVASAENKAHFEYWDAVDMSNNVAGDSANVAADTLYSHNLQQHTILDTIVISDARDASIGPML
jgi:hypothetical protein